MNVESFPYRNSDIIYWLWLSLCISPGSTSSDLLFEHFGPFAERIYSAYADEYDTVQELDASTKQRLADKRLNTAEDLLGWCNSNGVGLLPYDSEYYPMRLRNISAKPVLLYYKGKTPMLDGNLCVGMVGTRKISEYGTNNAYTISFDLANVGVTIVSGMALGTDAVCHRAALDAGGYTVAILGCGINRVYPPEHRDLMAEIFERGTVITEYCPDTAPVGRNFPIRNRIISGLCQATAVIEADTRSGSLITARHALAQGRDLFALPGNVGDIGSAGTNELIKNGARPVIDALDIINLYKDSYSEVLNGERTISKLKAYRDSFGKGNIFRGGYKNNGNGYNTGYNNKGSSGSRAPIRHNAVVGHPTGKNELGFESTKHTERYDEANLPFNEAMRRYYEKALGDERIATATEFSIASPLTEKTKCAGAEPKSKNEAEEAEKSEKRKTLKKSESGLSDGDYELLRKIPLSGGIGYDELVRCGIPSEGLLYNIIKLEIDGYIRKNPGGMYERTVDIEPDENNI